MLSLENVSLSYQPHNGLEIKALQNINLSFAPGERWAVIGPSGCGKSSLLLLLAGLLSPTSGEIRLNNKPFQKPQPEVALILQDHGLFPWKTVLENAMLGLVLQKVPKLAAREKASGILTSLGIGEQKDKYPTQLSGGQRQRVAIARALALEPKYLLMDEPFSALDALTREQLQAMVLELWKSLGFTMILVTHSIEEAVFLGGKIAIFSPAPGKIIKILDNTTSEEPLSRNSPEFYRQCARVRSFLERGIQPESC